jgi:NAD(P)-dependent dehydrogenase (short-subunit alcohol dehydrogenase family)
LELKDRHEAPLCGAAVLVTGGVTGIGRAVAAKFASVGARVAITSLPEDRELGASVAEELDRGPGEGRAHTLDVRSLDSIREVFGGVQKEFGRLDVLVNNAGVRLVASSLELGEREWDDVMGVNLRGVFFCSQHAARGMVSSGGGSIVNISSQLGLVAARDRAAYCAAKAGVIHLTRALAVDWAAYGIRVNAVAPGSTQTSTHALARTPEDAAALLARTPLGRPLETYEVAEAVAFLASAASSGVTGHTLTVDGGWTLS